MLFRSEAKLEASTADRIENIHKEYLSGHKVAISKPSKPKQTGPSLAERTKVGPKPKE